MKYNIFIFRRDLRLIDNNGLNYAMTNFENIIPIFIFTPEQIKKNKFKSDNAVQFMCESLKELNKELKKNSSELHIFYGDNIKIIGKIIKSIEVENIIFNMDYTPYAIKRDTDIEKLCKKNKITCHKLEDYLLAPVGTFNKDDGKEYSVFTPFKNNVLKHKIDKPNKIKIKNLIKKKLNTSKMIEYKENKDILVNGGRKEALKILNKIGDFKDYEKVRNELNIPTTHLSSYIKFGCVSVREVYWVIMNKLGKKHTLLSQLIWREFYFYVGYYNPNILKGKNYNSKYDGIKWKWNKKHFDLWCQGKTGFPVVDAGMRELNKTGFMHNRARLITSNFLNRILGMDWRWSEIYYAQKLTDYDPFVNNGNHQWIASTGTDPKPYFQRLFNPWLQSSKFDSDCEYIKKWVPELKNVDNKHIHEWYKYYDESIYIKPIVDYKKARKESIDMYRKILK